MGINLPQARLSGAPQLKKRQIPLEQILAVQGTNPYADAINQIGPLLSQALQRRQELRRMAVESDKRQTQADKEFGLKMVEQQANLEKMARGESIFNPLTNQTTVYPGIRGLSIGTDARGVPSLIKADDYDPGAKGPRLPSIPVPPQLPPGNNQELTDIDSAREQLRGLVQGAEKYKFGQGDPLIEQARASRLNPLRAYDPKAQGFAQLAASTKQIIGKGLEGGVLRKEDEYKYDAIIPKAGDTMDTIVTKAQQLDKLLQQKQANNLSGFNQAGFRGVPSPKPLEPISMGGSRIGRFTVEAE